MDDISMDEQDLLADLETSMQIARVYIHPISMFLHAFLLLGTFLLPVIVSLAELIGTASVLYIMYGYISLYLLVFISCIGFIMYSGGVIRTIIMLYSLSSMLMKFVVGVLFSFFLVNIGLLVTGSYTALLPFVSFTPAAIVLLTVPLALIVALGPIIVKSTVEDNLFPDISEYE